MTETPLVSVIIPTYNRADFLAEAIQSVLRQSYPHYEILVADDGSTDDTMERVASMDGPIRHLHLAHSGLPGAARNQAIKASRGPLVAFLDSDDLWLKDKLSKQVPIFLEDDHVGLVYSDISLIPDDISASEPVLNPRQLRPDSVFEELLKGCFIHPSTVLAPKRLFDRLGLFDLRFESQADYHFWLSAALNAPARVVPEPLTYVRKHVEGLSRQLGHRDWQNAINIFEHLLAHESLTLHQRLIARRTLSRFCTHVGLEHIKSGQGSHAISCFRRSLLWNPFQRRAWLALFHHLFPTRGHE